MLKTTACWSMKPRLIFGPPRTTVGAKVAAVWAMRPRVMARVVEIDGAKTADPCEIRPRATVTGPVEIVGLKVDAGCEIRPRPTVTRLEMTGALVLAVWSMRPSVIDCGLAPGWVMTGAKMAAVCEISPRLTAVRVVIVGLNVDAGWLMRPRLTVTGPVVRVGANVAAV